MLEVSIESIIGARGRARKLVDELPAATGKWRGGWLGQALGSATRAGTS
jgi:hypothetical protein